MTQRAFGSGVLKELSDQVRMTVRDVGMLMIVISDNTSTNALIDHVGGTDVVNARMSALGYPSITLHSNIPLPRRLAPGEQLPPVKSVAEATPADVARLMSDLAGRRLLRPPSASSAHDHVPAAVRRPGAPLLRIRRSRPSSESCNASL